MAVSPFGCPMRTEVILTSPHHEPPDDLRHPLLFSGHKGSMPAQPVGSPEMWNREGPCDRRRSTDDHWSLEPQSHLAHQRISQASHGQQLVRTVTVYKVSCAHTPASLRQQGQLHSQAEDQGPETDLKCTKWKDLSHGFPKGGIYMGWEVTEHWGPSFPLGNLLLSSRAALLWDPRCPRLLSGLYLLPRPFSTLWQALPFSFEDSGPTRRVEGSLEGLLDHMSPCSLPPLASFHGAGPA